MDGIEPLTHPKLGAGLSCQMVHHGPFGNLRSGAGSVVRRYAIWAFF